MLQITLREDEEEAVGVATKVGAGVAALDRGR